jgi:hypothetical protein
MLPKLIATLVRVTPYVDVAIETRDTLVRETKSLALSVLGVGFGSGLICTSVALFVCGLLGAVRLNEFGAAFLGTSAGAGILLAGVCGLRLKRANDRINAVKDMLSVRAARDAAAQLASTGRDIAVSGAASAQELGRAAATQVSEVASQAVASAQELARSTAGQVTGAASQAAAAAQDFARSAASQVSEAASQAASHVSERAKRILQREKE